jgi:antitoxin component YwqK of YwqJK toxin-antitoxin module
MRASFAALWLVALALLCTTALAGDPVRDERRLWSDSSPQEVWTYDGSILPENLLLKELFWEDGTKRSRAEFVAGVQHGAAGTWYPNGNKEIEETWIDGGRHGAVTHWPDPGDSKERKKQLKPTLEAEWVDGEPNGAWREWQGWGEDRWMKVEKGYAEGELDGFESVWRDEDSMSRKHSWKRGQLHGRQLGWDYNGEMAYQYNFADGEPEGPQRKYERDEIIQELFFVEGRLHGEMTWESWLDDLGPSWRHGLRTDQSHGDDGVLRYTQRYAFVPDERFDGDGRLQFHGDDRLVDTTKYRDDGSRETFKVADSPGMLLTFFPSGRLHRIEGGGSYVGPAFEWYPDGTLFREEHRDAHLRVGTWKIRDPQGRVVQVQQWDFNLQEQTVTLWHAGETKAAEGDIEHTGDSPNGRKTGSWTYWRPDGSLLRTEEYGPGPYSGNRSFITKMVEYDEQERPRFEGSERELLLYDYDDEDPELVRRRRTVKLLDRSRHGLERWTSETQTMERHPVQQPTELAEGAPVVELLGDRGLVLVDERFRSDGSQKQTERYTKAGERAGVQEGWYRDGTRAYAFEYFRGTLRGAQEWWSDGSPRLALTAHDGALRSLDLSDKGGRHWVLDDRGWRGPEELLERCVLWEFEPGAPRPER